MMAVITILVIIFILILMLQYYNPIHKDMNTSYTFKVENLVRESDGYVHTAYYTYTGVSTTGASVKTIVHLVFVRSPP